MVQVLEGISTSEAHLVGSAIAGEKSAYAELYKTHFDSVLDKVTCELCEDNPDRAREVVQQAFLDVFHNLSHIDRTVPFSESIMEAARDRAINADDHEKIERAGKFDFFDDDSFRNEDTDDADAGNMIAAWQATAERSAAIEALLAVNKSMDNKLAKGLRYLFDVHQKGVTLDELSKREGKSVKTIEKAIQQACEALRPVLAPLLT